MNKMFQDSVNKYSQSLHTKSHIAKSQENDLKIWLKGKTHNICRLNESIYF